MLLRAGFSVKDKVEEVGRNYEIVGPVAVDNIKGKTEASKCSVITRKTKATCIISLVPRT